MKKRIVAAVTAALLAIVGVAALVNYANGANERAYAGAKVVEVLQVQTDVPVGTPASRMAKSVKLVKVPATVKVSEALASLDSVSGLSTNVTLKAGEQLLRSRFGGAKATNTDTAVPDGYQEVSISVASPRIAGGKVEVGDLVGIIVSYDVEGAAKTTGFISQQKILVTRVSQTPVPEGGGSTAALVTIAVKTADAEKVVNAAEFGKIWLTSQNAKTDTTGRIRMSPSGVTK